MYYYLSIGTNINPEFNAAQIIHCLAREFSAIRYFPFVYTEPQGMQTELTFLNSAAIIESNLPPSEFKSRLNAIETELGRDRNDPLRSKKDRTADIDILGTEEDLDLLFFNQFKETYIRGVVAPEAHSQFADLSRYGLPDSPHLDRDSSFAPQNDLQNRALTISPLYFAHCEHHQE